MKQRRITETVAKRFLLDLLEPFHPPIPQGWRIVDITVKTTSNDVDFTFYIEKEV
jgi:hypothetical protein